MCRDACPESKIFFLNSIDTRYNELSIVMGIEYSIVDDIEVFASLRDEWWELLKKSSIYSPFMTWEWLYTWWMEYGQNDPNNKLCLVLARENGGLAAILPGYTRWEKIKGVSVNTLYFLGSQYESSDYLEIIITDKTGASHHVKELLERVIRSEKVDCFRFHNILENRPFLSPLRSLCDQHKYDYRIIPHRVCPFITIEGTYEEYLQSLSKKMRYNVRRFTRKLFQEQNAQLLTLQDGIEIDATLEQLFLLHARRASIKKRDSLFQYEMRGQFHKKVSHLFGERDILQLFQLRVEGQPIGIMYCFEFRGELFYFQGGIDPEWSKYSVGQVLIGQTIRYCFEKGLTRFDFMRGGEAYKFRWTDKMRRIVVADVGVTPKGKLVIRMEDWSKRAKQALKTVLPKQGWAMLKRIGNARQWYPR